jgi:hypothetical protein
MAFSIPSCPEVRPKTLEDLARERRWDAIRKNVPERAFSIIYRLVDESTLTGLGDGYNQLFDGKEVKIECDERVGLRIEYRGKIVFHYDSREGGPRDLCVKKYLPGEWEKELGRLEKLGKRLYEVKEKNSQEKFKLEREKELKENFGL